MKKTALFSLALVAFSPAFAAEPPLPLLAIGASYVNASTPFNDALQAPLGGIAVGLGSYLSLGDALVRTPTLPGYVINEAQAGATTFDRVACNPVCGQSGAWHGYDKQLDKALARVTAYDPLTGARSVNARYVVIGLPNDCMHSDAFGIPQDQTSPCSVDDLNAYLDRLIAVGQRAQAAGVTPIYGELPSWGELDLPLTQRLFGLAWVMDEGSYRLLAQLTHQRLTTELPDALVLDYWRDFRHMGDGMHPTPDTSARAAKRIAEAIRRREAGAGGHGGT